MKGIQYFRVVFYAGLFFLCGVVTLNNEGHARPHSAEALRTHYRNLEDRVQALNAKLEELIKRLDQIELECKHAQCGGMRENQVVPPPSLTSPATSPRQAYDRALSLLSEDQVDRSRQAFEDFVQQHPRDALTPQALYWLGTIHTLSQQYAEALSSFEKGYKLNPESAKATLTLFRMAQCHRSLGEKDQAIRQFKLFAERFKKEKPQLSNALEDEVRELARTLSLPFYT